PIYLCGWLHKMKRTQRKFRSTWARRWFTVQDGCLLWYTSPNTVESSGSIRLHAIKSVSRFEAGCQGSFSFVVNSSDRNMLLRAETHADLSRWIRGITLQLDLLRGGTIQG
ncbi:hypothetical protein JKP88DRAFT_151359, partial [Tribonema minus]